MRSKSLPCFAASTKPLAVYNAIKQFIKLNSCRNASQRESVEQLQNINEYLNQYPTDTTYLRELTSYCKLCLRDADLLYNTEALELLNEIFRKLAISASQLEQNNFLLLPFETQLDQLYNLQILHLYYTIIQNSNDNQLFERYQQRVKLFTKLIVLAADDYRNTEGVLVICRCIDKLVSAFQNFQTSQKSVNVQIANFKLCECLIAKMQRNTEITQCLLKIIQSNFLNQDQKQRLQQQLKAQRQVFDQLRKQQPFVKAGDLALSQKAKLFDCLKYKINAEIGASSKNDLFFTSKAFSASNSRNVAKSLILRKPESFSNSNVLLNYSQKNEAELQEVILHNQKVSEEQRRLRNKRFYTYFVQSDQFVPCAAAGDDLIQDEDIMQNNENSDDLDQNRQIQNSLKRSLSIKNKSQSPNNSKNQRFSRNNFQRSIYSDLNQHKKIINDLASSRNQITLEEDQFITKTLIEKEAFKKLENYVCEKQQNGHMCDISQNSKEQMVEEIKQKYYRPNQIIQQKNYDISSKQIADSIDLNAFKKQEQKQQKKVDNSVNTQKYNLVAQIKNQQLLNQQIQEVVSQISQIFKNNQQHIQQYQVQTLYLLKNSRPFMNLLDKKIMRELTDIIIQNFILDQIDAIAIFAHIQQAFSLGYKVSNQQLNHLKHQRKLALRDGNRTLVQEYNAILVQARLQSPDMCFQ